jgi:hypothetical protein
VIRTKTAAFLSSELYRLSLSGIHEWRYKYKSVCPYDSSKISHGMEHDQTWSFTKSAFTAASVNQWQVLHSGFSWMLDFTPAPQAKTFKSNYVPIKQIVTKESDSPGSHSH